MTAAEVLASELFRLTEQGVRVPCHDADDRTTVTPTRPKGEG